jgi:hypothetical protein
MHVIPAERGDNDEIGAILEIENRRGSRTPRLSASRRQHHEGRSPHRIAQFSAGQFPKPSVDSSHQANRFGP